MEEISKIVQEVLSNNRWGVYYKDNPIESLKAQDGVMVIRVNKIPSSDLVSLVQEELEKAINK